MILNLSIGEEIESDAREIEGHHVPVARVSTHTESDHAGEEIEKAEPKATTSAATSV
jgi:hypothetical protein